MPVSVTEIEKLKEDESERLYIEIFCKEYPYISINTTEQRLMSYDEPIDFIEDVIHNIKQVQYPNVIGNINFDPSIQSTYSSKCMNTYSMCIEKIDPESSYIDGIEFMSFDENCQLYMCAEIVDKLKFSDKWDLFNLGKHRHKDYIENKYISFIESWNHSSYKVIQNMSSFNKFGCVS